jgi:dihydroneopterin aldolase
VDRIVIRELRIQCIVGVLPAERVTPQEVVVSLDVGTDVARAARTGELDHTIDYAALAEQARALVVAGRYRLLETMAEDLARCALQSELAAEVRVTIRKPAAIAGARDAGVEIVRAR